MSLSAGDIIDGKYRIVRLLGEGGMGAVFEGENVRIHRKVAIKVLHGGVAENADAVQRFEREAQAAGRIGSEHIVEVLDLGNLESGDRYMVMEFLDGSSLSDRIRDRGRIPPTELFPIAKQMLDGLEAAHGAGIIHRDLKPDNVYLLRTRGGQADFVKLLDFGISKFQALSGDSGFSMTRTGAVMGTPYYMSPEQAKGAKGMDHRADLYAAGVILYECVTGQVPFNADTFNELLFKIVLETPPPALQLVPDLDPGFAAIVDKAMAREPGHRYQTCAEFREALEAWAQGQPITVAAPRAPSPSVVGLPASAPNAALNTTPGPVSMPSDDVAAAAPKKKSSTPLIAAAALVFVVIGGVAVAATMKSGDKPAPEPVAQPVVTQTAEPKPVEPPKPVETAAAPAATAAAAPVESAKVADSKPTASHAGTARTGAAAATAKTTAAKVETPPPATTSTAGGRKIRKDL